MEARFVIFLCVLAAAAHAANRPKIRLGFDCPAVRLGISQEAALRCCYSYHRDVNLTWIKTLMISRNKSMTELVHETNIRVELGKPEQKHGRKCSKLTLKDLVLNDTGLYQCMLTESDTSVLTPGTYLQVYVEPAQMLLVISERTKNSIITAEGVLLLLFVLIPGTMLMCKSKGLKELEKRKGREDENIYEGLNLDDCNSTYHQIQRSLVQGPYQDVINNDDEDIQLEKP